MRIFVDRKHETEFFRMMVRGQTQERIMVITDGMQQPGGSGKSLLGRELKDIARDEGKKVAWINCRTIRSSRDQFDLMYTIIDSLGSRDWSCSEFWSFDQEIKQLAYSSLMNATQSVGVQSIAARDLSTKQQDFSIEQIEDNPLIIQVGGNLVHIVNRILVNDIDGAQVYLAREKYSRRQAYHKRFFEGIAEYSARENGVVLFFDDIDLVSDVQDWIDAFCTLIDEGSTASVCLVVMGRSSDLPDFKVGETMGNVAKFELSFPSLADKDFLLLLFHEKTGLSIPPSTRDRILSSTMSFFEIWQLLDRCIKGDTQGPNWSADALPGPSCLICREPIETYDHQTALVRCVSCTSLVHLDCYTTSNGQYSCCNLPNLQAYVYGADEVWALYCLAAIPHSFDRRMLNWVYDERISANDWRRLLQSSAIEYQSAQVYYMHDLARRHIWDSAVSFLGQSLARKWNRSCAQYLAWYIGNHSVLEQLEAQYGSPKVRKAPNTDFDVDSIQRASVELVYHLLLLDWNCFLPRAYDAFESARLSSNLNLASVLRDYASEVVHYTQLGVPTALRYFDLAVAKLKGDTADIDLRQRALKTAAAALDMNEFFNRRLFQDISNLLGPDGGRQ